MVTTAADACFVDTNILVYATVSSSPWNAAARARLDDMRRLGTRLWISRQVLREYMGVLTRGNPPPLPKAAVLLAAEDLSKLFDVADDDAAVTSELISLLRRFPGGGKQVHDTNIVATMACRGIRRLLTQNVADFQRFGTLVVVESL
jgi:predicted nucleic acid-binding protein